MSDEHFNNSLLSYDSVMDVNIYLSEALVKSVSGTKIFNIKYHKQVDSLDDRQSKFICNKLLLWGFTMNNTALQIHEVQYDVRGKLLH